MFNIHTVDTVSMGKRRKGHLIGDPVVFPKEKGLIRSFGHRNYFKRYIVRTLLVLVIAVILCLIGWRGTLIPMASSGQ